MFAQKLGTPRCNSLYRMKFMDGTSTVVSKLSDLRVLYNIPFYLFLYLMIAPAFGENRALHKRTSFYLSSERGDPEKHLYDISSIFDTSFQETSLKSDYAIAHPARVDHRGQFLSHKVRFLPENSPEDFATRKKRGLKKDDCNLFFRVKIEDEDLTLNMTKNRKLLHSNFVVERLRQENNFNSPIPPHRSSLQRGTNWPCHFHGHVIGRPGSVVALSTCNGLSGFIRLKNGDYFIEPLRKSYDDSGSEVKQPHKIYKREATRDKRRLDDSRSHSDTASAFDREPTMDFTKQKHSTRNSQDKIHKEGGLNSSRLLIDAGRWQNVSSNFSDRNFCGVKDTKHRYRRDLLSRVAWEKRRRRKSLLQGHKKRKRRSLSMEHWIEMMVVVDRKMVEYYEIYHEEEVERYVLTIINMVSELFHDVSIGNSLHITLIRLILLEGEERGVTVTPHAQKTLDSFCRWAKRMNPRSDTHANHHDVAVLLTRRNICSNSNKSCETLGLAHVAGMCQSHRSCNVNQDTGLSLAFTIAHEIGHNLAMHHDGQLNNCEPEEQTPRVMSPHLTSNNLPMRWSPCSRRYVTRFLDRNWGFCLLDVPSSEHDQFEFPSDLPGILYDADHQCRLMFGPRSKHCKGVDDICNRLWCVYQGSCRSRLHAAVPGTKCGKRRWCYAGKCVALGRRPKAIDGSWGSWTKWSRCSRTCGVGVSYSARYCNQPTPRNGGRYCLGERRRYRTCNIWKCPKTNNTLTFREEQCAEFNNILYRNKTYIWLPVQSATYPCELHCYTRTSKTPFADRLRDKVVDGTPCYNRGKDICIDGICKILGCDLKIDSMAQEDKCGVCRGDGSTCSDVESSFTLLRGDEYVEVGVLPKGARNIKVFENKPSGNFLALKSTLEIEKYYLNGDYMIQWDTSFDLAGTAFMYQRINKTQDNITAEGPLIHDIVVMVLFVEDNPGINISYVLPHNVTASLDKSEKPPQFSWMRQPWSPCTRTCGKGVRVSRAICVETKAGIVEDDFCDKRKRPKDRRRFCSNQRCAPEWFTGPWQPCSVTCGNDVGRQRRTVLCIRNINDNEQVVLSRTKCKMLTHPRHSRSCFGPSQLPCPVWREGLWGNCSVPCGGGFRSRTAKCVTYIINDVISVIAEDIASIDKERLKPHLVDQEDSSYTQIHIPGQTALVTLNKVTILQRRKQKHLLENFDFNVEDDEQCNTLTKPLFTEPCNTNRCDILLSSNTVDEFDSIYSPSAEQQNRVSVTINPHHDSSTESISYSEELDIPGDLEKHKAVNSHPFRNYSSSHDNDTLDINFSSNVTINGTVLENNTVVSNIFSNNVTSAKSSWKLADYISHTTTIFTPTAVVTFEDGNGQNDLVDNATTTPSSKSSTPRFKWLTGAWGQCSTSCGVGARIRNVICNGGSGECDEETQPAPAQRCNLKPCANWQYGEWSKCSRQCGRGRKHLKVYCRDSRTNELLRPYHCKSHPKLPLVNRSCNNRRRCLPWKTSKWSTCSVTCGTGIQRRRIACSRRGMCVPRHKPSLVIKCNTKPCVEWKASQWQRCSANCGTGLKRRSVVCVEKTTRKLSNTCNPQLKPNEAKKCNEGPCRITDYDFTSCTGDWLKTRFCEVLKQWGKCVQPSIAIQCCIVCKTYLSNRDENKNS